MPEGTSPDPLGLTCIHTDATKDFVSERKDDLDDAERRVRSLVSFLPVVIWEVDVEGIITLSEGKGLAALGFAPGQLVGLSVFEMYKDRPDLTENTRRALRGEEFTALAEVGDVSLEVRMGPKRDEQGRVIGVAGVGIDVTERVRMAKAEQGFSRRLFSVLEDERRRIARELHDEAGQTVTALKLLLDRAGRSQDAAEMRALICDATRLCGSVLEELRRISLDLRPGSLDVLGLLPSVEELVLRFGRSAGIAATLEAPAVLPAVDADAQAAIYRFVQEALTNVSRHAKATRVGVRMRLSAERVSVEAVDDGVGFVPSKALCGSGLGLIGMTERSRMLGGKLVIDSSPGRGTTIRLYVPLAAAP